MVIVFTRTCHAEIRRVELLGDSLHTPGLHNKIPA